jgi:A/G-specific adenine glycosylase
MSSTAGSFAARVVRWQRQQGRHHLPWQGTRDPYRVWLSEVMLQQTQVTTVLDYYARFLERFPTVTRLAAAPLDDVLALWSGLGYYSRARNLHRCAQAVMTEHAGAFPQDAQTLEQLPGIGRSTAAAIAAFCYSQPVAILDANVKRVITRHAGFAADLSIARNERDLWALATERLPRTALQNNMPAYTQGLMDLGTAVCTTRSPQCANCPVQTDCRAALLGTPERFPVKTRKLKRSAQAHWLLLLQNKQGEWWLQQRPLKGIWGGLYVPPMFDTLAAAQTVLRPAELRRAQHLSVITHTLTHKDLFLHPVQVPQATTPATSTGAWYSPEAAAALGLPAPIRVLLNGLA